LDSSREAGLDSIGYKKVDVTERRA
jgi:hypothetical protein